MSAVPRPTSNLDLRGGAHAWILLTERLTACTRRLRTAIQIPAAHHGLSEAQFSVLWACGQGPTPGLSQNDLADALAVSPARISGLVEPLRQRGLLATRRSPTDQRRRIWRLTDPGLALVQAVVHELAPWARRLEQHLAELDPAQWETMATTAERIGRATSEPRARRTAATRRPQLRPFNPEAGRETCDVPAAPTHEPLQRGDNAAA